MRQNKGGSVQTKNPVHTEVPAEKGSHNPKHSNKLDQGNNCESKEYIKYHKLSK